MPELLTPPEPVLEASLFGAASPSPLKQMLQDAGVEAKVIESLLGAGTPDLVIKQGDTFPPVVAALSTNGQLVDLATAITVKFLMKGVTAPLVGPSSAVKLTVVTPTATTSLGSNVLTAVSNFTSIVQGGSITGNGIPPGARVSTFDSTAQTITMTDNLGNTLNAIASASGVTITVNKGSVSYSWGGSDTLLVDTYSVEWEVTWPGGIQTFPNNSYGTIQILASLDGV